MRLKHAALVLVSAFALESACRNLDGEPSGGSSAGGTTDVESGGAGGKAMEDAYSGEAGEAGTSGGARDDGDAIAPAGSAGLSSSAAGTSGVSGGFAGASDRDSIDPSTEEVAAPGCVAGITQSDPKLSTPRGLTANLVPNGEPYVLYTSDPQSNMLLLRFKKTSDDNGEWTPWSCFDSVVRPEQISAINIDDLSPPYNTPEVYATNAAGRLFVRRFFMNSGWAPWEAIGLPRWSSQLTDVSASSTHKTLPFLYVLDGGRVFTRHHTSIQAYSNYTPWREVSGVPVDALNLCAGVRPDRRQQLFVSTASGNLFAAVQANSDPEAEFAEFQPLVQASTHAMTDIDCGYLADGTLTVLGLSSGTLWSTNGDAPASLDWQKEPTKASLQFTVFALGSRPGAAPTVFGIDSSNVVWWRLLGTPIWTSTD
ncbi:MAG: hypothetical protein ABW061_04475 [Polyangiaceae bacterium]